jgi:hypothetical protein
MGKGSSSRVPLYLINVGKAKKGYTVGKKLFTKERHNIRKKYRAGIFKKIYGG